jgi:hypothetical protein
MAPPHARRRGRAVRPKVRAAHLELRPLRRTLRYRLKSMLSERSQGASVCAQAVVDGGMRRGTVKIKRRPRSFAHELHPSQRQALECTEERQLEQQTCFCSWDLSSASRVVRTARSTIGLVSPSMHVRRAVPSLDHARARAAGGDRDVCARARPQHERARPTSNSLAPTTTDHARPGLVLDRFRAGARRRRVGCLRRRRARQRRLRRPSGRRALRGDADRPSDPASEPAEWHPAGRA